MNLELNRVDLKYIIDEIKHLEMLSADSYTKEATQFKYVPLHPLWHQHYFSYHYLVHNIQSEVKKKFNTIWEESIGEKTPLWRRSI